MLQKRIRFEFGDIEELNNGSKIFIDSVSRYLEVKLDTYTAGAILTDEEIEQLLKILNKLKEI